MPSLVNTLLRCHSTVRALRKSCAPISGFDEPSRASRAICSSCGVSSSRVSKAPLAHLLAGCEQLAAGALGERLHADRDEHVVGGPQLLACVDASALAAQPLAVEQMRAGELGTELRMARADRSLRGRAPRRPRRRSAAPGSGPRCRARTRCRQAASSLPAGSSASRASSASPGACGRLDELGQRPHRYRRIEWRSRSASPAAEAASS